MHYICYETFFVQYILLKKKKQLPQFSAKFFKTIPDSGIPKIIKMVIVGVKVNSY